MGIRTALPAIIILATLHSSSALAQSATATGTGIAASRSQSTAVAISGQGGAGGNGQGGNAAANNSLTFNSNVPATQTVNSVASGTQTIRNVPTEFAPGLTAAGLETCLGSVSGGAAVIGTGASFGSTIPDPGCAARLDARTLWSFGLRKAAVARLCLMVDIQRAMPDVCYQYLRHRPRRNSHSSVSVLLPLSKLQLSSRNRTMPVDL